MKKVLLLLPKILLGLLVLVIGIKTFWTPSDKNSKTPKVMEYVALVLGAVSFVFLFVWDKIKTKIEAMPDKK
jgi:hypothetical protein